MLVMVNLLFTDVENTAALVPKEWVIVNPEALQTPLSVTPD